MFHPHKNRITSSIAMAEMKAPNQALNFWTKHRIGRENANRSFTPTFVQVPTSKEASAPSNSNSEFSGTTPSLDSSATKTQLTRSYLKGLEENSAFIDSVMFVRYEMYN
jgi:hypothetical protein